MNYRTSLFVHKIRISTTNISKHVFATEKIMFYFSCRGNEENFRKFTIFMKKTYAKLSNFQQHKPG